jgi:hypothetical protein
MFIVKPLKKKVGKKFLKKGYEPTTSINNKRNLKTPYFLPFLIQNVFKGTVQRIPRGVNNKLK